MKYAVFGGTFDPPHLEHISIMRHLLSCGYDRVIALVTGNPPHKHCRTDGAHRLAMIKAATAGDERIIVDETELNNPSLRYSADILPILKDKYGDIHYVIGGDSLIDLHKWSRPDSVVKICPLVVFKRGDNDDRLLEAKSYWEIRGAKITLMDYQPRDISSTLIRYGAMLGVYKDVPQEVEQYIRSNSLYSKYDDVKAELKLHVKPARYEHSVRTCECALRLNYYCKLNLDYDKVFIAALLHDCGKGSSQFDIAKANKPLPPDADDEDRQRVESVVEYDLSAVPQDAIGKPVEHQYVGAIVAKQLFGIEDSEILDAIRYHCTARENMSCLEKLIYCADVLEQGRNYDGVEELRQLIKMDFNAGFSACLDRGYNHVLAKGGKMYYLTEQAQRFYNGK
ncbi:MAG: nicotinate (nicotinamide) nucleotide adenylyltransferase [Clostridia bacterium]|nr:nicotinate (nicotinamide) nucleotide adenylyltransferase [Clostridia bacterium]